MRVVEARLKLADELFAESRDVPSSSVGVPLLEELEKEIGIQETGLKRVKEILRELLLLSSKLAGIRGVKMEGTSSSSR